MSRRIALWPKRSQSLLSPLVLGAVVSLTLIVGVETSVAADEETKIGWLTPSGFVGEHWSAGAGPANIVTSPDSRHLYAIEPQRIQVFSRSSGNDSLTLLGSVDTGLGPSDRISDAVMSVDGGALYLASPSASLIEAFQQDPIDGSLHKIGTVANGPSVLNALGGVSDLSVSSDGLSLYSAASDPGAVVAFSIQADYGLKPIDVENGLVGGAHQLAGANQAEVFPSGEGLLVSTPARNSVFFFRRDKASGQLTLADWSVEQPPDYSGNVTPDLLVAPPLGWTADQPLGNESIAGDYVYVTSSDSNWIWRVRNWFAPKGGLTSGEWVSAPLVENLLHRGCSLPCTDLAMPSDGTEQIYNAFPDGRLVGTVNAIDPLTHPGVELVGDVQLEIPRDGAHLYAASEEMGGIWIFRREHDGVPPDTTHGAPPIRPFASVGDFIAFSTRSTEPFDLGESNRTYFDCRLDGGEFQTCAEMFDPYKLEFQNWWVQGLLLPDGGWDPDSALGTQSFAGRVPAGSHVLEVRARDKAGNPDPTPLRYEFTVTPAPAPELVVAPEQKILTRSSRAQTLAFKFERSRPDGTLYCRLLGASRKKRRFRPCDGGEATYRVRGSRRKWRRLSFIVAPREIGPTDLLKYGLKIKRRG